MVIGKTVSSLLNQRHLPARLSTEQVAEMLQCSTEDVRIARKAGLLRPLGNGGPSAVLYFPRVTIEEASVDVDFLEKFTRAVQAANRRKNGTEP